jgi:predicted MFS family arabinose efflux permease
MSVVMVIGFQFIAYLTESQTAASATASPGTLQPVARWIFSTYAAAAVAAALVFLPNQPRSAATSTVPSGPAAIMPAPTARIGLLAILLAFMAQGGIWSFLQVLGISHGFPVRGVANAMSAFAIAGIAGSLAAAAVPQRWPRWATVCAAMLVLWLGLYSLYAPASLAWYVLGCGIGGFYWNFVLPLILGILARVDATGSAAVLGGTMSSAGSALGPLIAGRLIQDGSYHPVGWMAAGLCLASLICVWAVERRAARESAVVPIAVT